MWYKKEGDKLLKGTKIFNKDWSIDETTDTSEEIQGWKWFDNEDAAYAHFQLEKPANNTKPGRNR